ncbi:MAG TPA: molybdopterin-dependent oxidoreductase [Acetobacteraceae bacterium]|nr:molybdopterin-dependent oxidoreductase [Acetobacteraceae bacterium]
MTDGPADKITLIGAIKEKLIGKKQDWAREGRLLTGKTADHATRLPPGQHLVSDWPVLDLGIQPLVPRESFRLVIDGAVSNAVALGWADIMALPQTIYRADMHCVTQWSRYDNEWQGVAARTIIELVQPLAAASHVIFHAHDDYITNVTLDQFDQTDAALVHSWQGQPIERLHGGPLRGMIPKLYLWKSAKWIKRIEFATADHPGFWETRGYNNNADPWLEERYS